MTLRIKVRQLKRLMARKNRTSEELPGIELTHEDIERACAEVRAINAAGKGTGRIHVIGGLPAAGIHDGAPGLAAMT
jgi:hypothetical protein